MKKILMVLVILAATASPGRAESDLWKEAGRACVFGGAVLGVTSMLVLYPALVTGQTALPATSLVLGNTIFGCGIASLGAAAASGFSWAYDSLFGAEKAEPPATAKPSSTGGNA
ncbi:MAG: hypothetical protein GC191_13950 [Azospirillum sp.]|nr:hypothetical protein [Azospirillum sp.]